MRPTIENAQKQQAYIDSLKQQFGEMTPVEKSLRERSVDALTPVIGALPFGSGGDFRDRKIAKNLLGDYYADSIADSIGVADFTPAGLVFGVDEALREYKQAEKPTDFILPTVGLGLSAVEAYPVTKVITKPLRTFLNNLANKTSVPTDVSRRTFIQGAVAAPVVAGALSQIPLSTTSQVIPKTFNIFKDLPKFTKILDKDLESILGYDIPLKNFKDKIMKRSGVFSAQSGILMKDLSKEIKELFPRTTKKDIEKYLDNLKNVQYLDDSGEFVFRGEKKINTKN